MKTINNKKILKTLKILLIFFFISNKVYAQTVASLDLIPFEQTISINEIEIKGFNEDLFNLKSKNMISNSVHNKINNSFAVGYLSSGHNKFGISLKSSKFENESKFTNETFNLLKSKIIYINKNQYNILNNWDNIFTFSYSHIPDYKIFCYETDNYIIGGGKKNCKSTSKKLLISSFDGYEFPAILSNSSSYDFGVGFRKQNVLWDKKVTFGIGFESSFINHNNVYGSGFKNINIKKLLYIPSNIKYNSQFLKLRAFQSQSITETWALGLGVSSYIRLHSSDQNVLYKNLNHNLILNTKLTKRVKPNFYISLGSILSTNYLLGIEPIVLNARTSNLHHSPYGEINLKFGIYLDEFKQTFLDKNTNEFEKFIKKPQSFTEKTFKASDKIKKNKKVLSLEEFAINYAYKYDQSLNLKFTNF